MGDTLLRIYHKLPPPLRSVAASLHGFYLRHWRYGTETDQLVAEALERDYWSSEQWKKWQTERLHQLLHRAARQVPYYRQYWEERRRRGDGLSFECLENWPILSKEMLRRGPASFLADDCDRRRMIHEHTSGTTGTPLDIWQSRKTSRQWYALYEARTRNWNGISRRDRWGIIGAQQVVPRNTKSPPFWVWNAGLNQLYLSAFHLAPWSCQSYLDAIKRYRVKYLLGYTNSLAYLAKVATESSEKLSLAVVITNGEPLSDLQRKIISEGFECPVRETYGMSEIACGATECHAGKLHLWPEAGVIEILDENSQPAPSGTSGRLIATGLLNFDMPLIRYETRDVGSFSSASSPCSCGRRLPTLGKLMGRADDVVITKDGRRLVQFDGIFDSSLHIKEGQIIQKKVDSFLIKVVPSKGWSQSDADRLKQAILDRVGDASVTIESTPHIERTWAGKFRIIISEVGK